MRPLLFNATLLGSRGGNLGTVSISNYNEEESQEYPTAATIVYALNSDGSSVEGGGAGRWLIGSTSGSSYEARVTETSGTLSSGTTGSWLALSSNRTWYVTRASMGSKSCTFTVEIGLLGSSTALDTASITLIATVSAP